MEALPVVTELCLRSRSCHRINLRWHTLSRSHVFSCMCRHFHVDVGKYVDASIVYAASFVYTNQFA